MSEAPRVLIAGAGPGGLLAALALRRQGVSCGVIERVERGRLFADVGGGYHIGSTTLAMLDHLGAGQSCREAGLRFGAFRVWTSTGRLLQHMPIPPTLDMVTLRRSALQATLLTKVGDEVLRCGVGVARVEQDERQVRVELDSGEVLRAELLIAADGVYSKVRESLFGDGPPSFCGLSCCWGRVAASGIEALADFPPADALSQLGPGASVAVAQIDGEVLWSAFWRTPSFERRATPDERKARVVERFRGWASPTPEILAATAAEQIAETGIWDRAPGERWYAGRVALIGDAAHPMTPFLGQGANSAMLDAYVLAHHLGRGAHGLGQIREAFAAYQARRKPDTDRNVRKARQISDFSTSDRAWQRRLMAGLMRLLPPRLMLRTMLRADVLNDVSDLLRRDHPAARAKA